MTSFGEARPEQDSNGPHRVKHLKYFAVSRFYAAVMPARQRLR
jgi:hypothetical protein